MNRIEYLVITDDSSSTHTDLEDAIRTWNGRTYARNDRTIGGICVKEWQAGVLMRDGYLLHVKEEGTVYLNPSLATATIPRKA